MPYTAEQREKRRENKRKYDRKSSIEITDAYIASFFKVPLTQLSQHIINAKRMELIVRRYATGSPLLSNEHRQWMEMSEEERAALRKKKSAKLRMEAQKRYCRNISAQLTDVYITRELVAGGIARADVTAEMITRKRESIIQHRSKRMKQRIMAERVMRRLSIP
jgi:hypothetical protein